MGVEIAVLDAQSSRWLMIAGDTNCGILSDRGYPFYALNGIGRTLAGAVAIGDRCVLYRARSSSGFIGVFEVTELAKDLPTRVGARTYATRIPWKPILLCEHSPVRLQTLVLELSFITNKARFWTHFQTTMKRLLPKDFEAIERAVRKNVQAELSAVDGGAT